MESRVFDVLFFLGYFGRVGFVVGKVDLFLGKFVSRIFASGALFLA